MSAKSGLVSRASTVVLGLEHGHICPREKMLIARLEVTLCFPVSCHRVGAVPLNNVANWFTLYR